VPKEINPGDISPNWLAKHQRPFFLFMWEGREIWQKGRKINPCNRAKNLSGNKIFYARGKSVSATYNLKWNKVKIL